MFSAKTILVRSAIFAAMTTGLAACGSSKKNGGDESSSSVVASSSTATVTSSSTAAEVSSSTAPVTSSSTATEASSSADTPASSSSVMVVMSSSEATTSSDAVESSSSVADASSSESTESSSSTNTAVVNLLSGNGEFANGQEDFGTFTEASTDADFSFDNEYVNVEISDGSDAAWKINLQHPIASLEATDYTVCFSARSDEPRVITTSIDVGGVPIAGSAFNRDITETYQQFMHTVTLTEAKSGADLVIGLGGSNVNVNIDNVGVFKGSECGMFATEAGVGSVTSSSPVEASSSSVAPASSSSLAPSSSSVAPASSSSEVVASSSQIIVIPSSSSVAPSSVAPSSVAPSSSSVAPVSSSSVAPSSSSVAPSSSSSSSEASSSSVEVCSPESSSAASSSAPAIAQCSTHTEAAGRVEFARCVLCHAPFSEDGADKGISIGAVSYAGQVIDANDTLWGGGFTALATPESSDLAAYIENSMGPFVSGCDADCAKNIEVHIRALSDNPICLDNPPVASSSEASSSSTCVPASSSEGSTSSEAPTTAAKVEFVFPPQGAHLGGADETAVSLKVLETEVDGDVSGVTLNGNALTSNGDMWEMDKLAIAATNDQSFDVVVTVGTQDLDANALIINNLGGEKLSKAGNTRILAATGLAVDTDGTLYFSNGYNGKLYKYDPETAESTVIYESSTPAPSAGLDLTNELYWPISVKDGKIYLFEDSYSYSDTAGSGEYDVKLVMIESDGTVTSYEDSDGFVDSARGIVVDLMPELASSGFGTRDPFPTIYSSDFSGVEPIHRWILEDASTVTREPITPTASDSDSAISADLGVSAFAGYLDGDNSRLAIIREFVKDGKQGKASLIEIVATASARSSNSTGTKIGNLDFTNSPSALIYGGSANEFYIADANRIWKYNSETDVGEIVSSTNIIPMKRGSGPTLGSAISAMAMHPTMDNYMYIATGDSIMLVNLESGDRVALIK